MALYGSLIATPSLATSNSYATVGEADDVMGAHLYSTDWDGSANQAEALMYATRILDQMYIWKGDQADTDTQRLAWPRTSVFTVEGVEVTTTTIPQFLKEATAELALLLIQKDLTKEPTRGFRRVKTGPVEVEFDPHNATRTMPRYIQQMLAPYGMARDSSGTLSVARV